jgi:membrane-bound lytic murein transglycosylase B
VAVLAAAGVGAAAGATVPGSAPPPPPSKPIPRDPGRVASELAATTARLHAAIARWRREGTGTRRRPPEDVELLALYQQRIYRLLTRERRLAERALPRVPSWLRRQARATVEARRGVARITPPATASNVRVGPAQPADVLLRHYLEAQRRFRVSWYVLASVNFVESAFGRVRSSSAAGARGPMQFLPSTWRQYGLGGDVDDPHDAILGAANYLRAAGAPRRYRRALYAYNPSWAYVRAIQTYANHMRRNRRAYYAYYSWQVYVRTPRGDRRLTGPGRR